jgi:hypothetical protein
MKNYAEINADLREEIMQQIDLRVDNLLAKYEVYNISDIEGMPTLGGYVIEQVDDGEGGIGYSLVAVKLKDIFIGGECAGYSTSRILEPYALYEFITDSLIDILEELEKFSNK